MFDYFKDGINPRGAEYGATARAADAAQRSAEDAGDMLEMQLAASESERREIAARIRDRRVRQASQRAWWQRLDLIASAFLVGGIAWYMLTPHSDAPKSAVTQEAPASVSTGAPDAPAPEITARAPDNAGMNNTSPCVEPFDAAGRQRLGVEKTCSE